MLIDLLTHPHANNYKTTTELETQRTRMRRFTMNDLDDFARMLANPRVMKYLGLDCQPVERDEARNALNSIIKHWDRNGFGRWAVVSKLTDQVIGCAGLRSFNGTAELVYMLDEPFWGQGLATEIAEACLEYGFEQYDFPRIIAMTRPGNAASRRVMDKIGMRFEKEDVVFDIFVVQYEITLEDYKTKKIVEENLEMLLEV